MHKLINDLNLVGYISVLWNSEYELDLNFSLKKKNILFFFFFFFFFFFTHGRGGIAF